MSFLRFVTTETFIFYFRPLHQAMLVKASKVSFASSTRPIPPAKELYSGHVPTTMFQKAVLGIGSSVAALANPWRADMVAVNGEVTGMIALKSMLARMEAHPEGAQILSDRPRISTNTVNFDELRQLPKSTLGTETCEFFLTTSVRNLSCFRIYIRHLQ